MVAGDLDLHSLEQFAMVIQFAFCCHLITITAYCRYVRVSSLWLGSHSSGVLPAEGTAVAVREGCELVLP